MIHYSCDRCRCPLDTPINVNSNSIPTLKEAKKGIELVLPVKTSVSYTFVFTHLCESCLGELAIWKNAKMSQVDHTMVDDR